MDLVASAPSPHPLPEGEGSGALIGLRVVELATPLTAFCGKLLADMGADVLLVESLRGSPQRREGPFHGAVADPERSLPFWHYNTNKRGITLDLAQPDGPALLRRLLAEADVLIEAEPVGSLAARGFGFEALHAEHPRLVVVSLAGFGQTGPRSGWQATELIAQALGGMAYTTGKETTPPLKTWGEQAAQLAGMYGAIGALLAFARRAATGEGEQVDVSTQEAVASALEIVLPWALYEPRTVHRRQGSLHWSRGFRLFPSSDGYILFTLNQNWETLVGWLEADGTAEDLTGPQYREPAYRREQLDHIIAVLERRSRTKTVDELMRQGQLLRFTWGQVNTPEQLLANDQLRERGFFVELDHPHEGRTFTYAGAPAGFSSSPWRLLRPAPRLGEHNEDVLRALTRSLENQERRPLQAASAPPRVAPLRPLEGVRVLDFTWVLAGPYATRLLADFGAEVVKVQSLATTREGIVGLTEDARRGYFNLWNRNKLGITLNMGTPEGIELAKRLVTVSDVVIENFSARVLANWGLDYENLVSLRPDIILVSMAGMGQTGPWRDFVSYGPTLQALSGLTALTTFPGLPPLGLTYSYSDHVGGLTAALAVLAALEHRRRTGEGQHIDLSQFEAMAAFMGPLVLRTALGVPPQPTGNRHPQAAPHGIYRCAGEDRWVAIAVMNDGQWQALAVAMGQPEWTQEARFASLEGRLTQQDDLDRLVEEWTLERSPEEVQERLQAAGVPAGLVASATDLLADPQLQARGFFVETDHPLLGRIALDRQPIHLSADVGGRFRPAPLPGQDNVEVFGRVLGLTPEEVRAYEARQVIW